MNGKFIYSMTNSRDENEVVAYKLDESSKLVKIGSFETKGKGTGKGIVDPLVSQGSIVISKDCNLLFVVNAGSNTISVFKIFNDGDLMLATVVSSYGINPVALSTYENILVVVNKGDKNTASNIALFTFNCSGLIRVSCEPNYYGLSSPKASPSSVTIKPSNLLETEILVSELNLSRISVFKRKGCRLSRPIINRSATPNPFVVLALDNELILGVETGDENLTSYSLRKSGVLSSVDSIPTNGKASCWISVTPNNKYAYVSNTESGTISIFSIKSNVKLRFLGLIDSVPNMESAPIDSSISSDGKYFYVLNGDKGSISAFKISGDGSLEFVDLLEDTSLPGPGCQGLASI